MKKLIILLSAIILIVILSHIPEAFTKNGNDQIYSNSVLGSEDIFKMNSCESDASKRDLYACVVEPSAMDHVGLFCLNLVPMSVNLVNELAGTDTRMALFEEHWDAYRNATLGSTLKESYGWMEGESFDCNLWNVTAQALEGVFITGPINMAETNWNRATHPVETMTNLSHAVANISYEIQKDLFTPIRGALYSLGYNVESPTNEEWARSYLTWGTILYPVARSATTAKTLTTVSQKAGTEASFYTSYAASSATQVAQNTLNKTVQLTDDLITKGQNLAQEIVNSTKIINENTFAGGKQLCFAGTGVGTGVESKICVISTPQNNNIMLRGLKPPSGTKQMSHRSLDTQRIGGGFSVRRAKINPIPADFTPELKYYLDKLKGGAKLTSEEISQFKDLAYYMRKEFPYDLADYGKQVTEILKRIEKQGVNGNELYTLMRSTLHPAKLITKLEKVATQSKVTEAQMHFLQYSKAHINNQKYYKLKPALKKRYEDVWKAYDKFKKNRANFVVKGKI